MTNMTVWKRKGSLQDYVMKLRNKEYLLKKKKKASRKAGRSRKDERSLYPALKLLIQAKNGCDC